MYGLSHDNQFTCAERFDHVGLHQAIMFVLLVPPQLLVIDQYFLNLFHGWWVSIQSIIVIIIGGKLFPQQSAVVPFGCCLADCTVSIDASEISIPLSLLVLLGV